jgi:hypothetical protein
LINPSCDWRAVTEQQPKMLEDLLWNVEIKEQEMASVKFKGVYELMANAPKNGDFAQMLRLWDDIGTYSSVNSYDLSYDKILYVSYKTIHMRSVRELCL